MHIIHLIHLPNMHHCSGWKRWKWNQILVCSEQADPQIPNSLLYRSNP